MTPTAANLSFFMSVPPTSVFRRGTKPPANIPDGLSLLDSPHERGQTPAPMKTSTRLASLWFAALLGIASGCGPDVRPLDTAALHQAAAPSRWVFVSNFPSGTGYSNYGLANRNLRIYLPEDYWT